MRVAAHACVRFTCVRARRTHCMDWAALSYDARAALLGDSPAGRLLALAARKKTNLAFAADYMRSADLVAAAERVGPHICVLKTHADAVDDFGPATAAALCAAAQRHSFFVFEDRKFADIGATVERQYVGGVLRIAEWADYVDAHVCGGDSTVRALADAGQARGRGLFLVGEMSTGGRGDMDGAAGLAQRHRGFVAGFVAQERRALADDYVWMMPGVGWGGAAPDRYGQHYCTPAEAVAERGADVVIVGRGIRDARDLEEETQRFRELQPLYVAPAVPTDVAVDAQVAEPGSGDWDCVSICGAEWVDRGAGGGRGFGGGLGQYAGRALAQTAGGGVAYMLPWLRLPWFSAAGVGLQADGVLEGQMGGRLLGLAGVGEGGFGVCLGLINDSRSAHGGGSKVLGDCGEKGCLGWFGRRVLREC
ncbi:hypothetical protein PMAC_003065 [Pneumocystis sp. 'macacae']|nr:hypothetical protein PMAC_003065 [Pneumocystis sp. 'macacae']